MSKIHNRSIKMLSTILLNLCAKIRYRKMIYLLLGKTKRILKDMMTNGIKRTNLVNKNR
jgi:hypothetical protein